MKQHLRYTKFAFIGFAIATLFLSACGGARRPRVYALNADISDPTPELQINDNPLTDQQHTSILMPQLEVTASATSAEFGRTIYVSARYLQETAFDFRLDPPNAGFSFTNAATGVSSVGVKSLTPGSVTVYVRTRGSNPQERSVSLSFTTPIGPVNPSQQCTLAGPSAVTLGSSGVFEVRNQLGEALQITNVWTENSSERANFYYSWSRFTLGFIQEGQRTVYVRAISLYSRVSCDAQATVSVTSTWTTPTPGPVPPPVTSCGRRSENRICAQWAWDVPQVQYYVEGGLCRSIVRYNDCADSGPFSTLSACEAALRAGTCSASPSQTETRTLNLDSRATSWVDTGIDIQPGQYVSIVPSGQIRYANSQWAYTGPTGVNLSGYNACKHPAGRNYANASVLASLLPMHYTTFDPFSVAVSGTSLRAETLLSQAFWAGQAIYGKYNGTRQTQRLYLVVNDTGCAQDNSGSFQVRVTTSNSPPQ